MSINETELMIEQLREEEKSVKECIGELENKLSDIRSQIKRLEGNEPIPWSEKAIEYISIAKELLSTDEILRSVFLHRRDDLTDVYKRRGYVTGLSVALHHLCKNRKLFPHAVKGVKGLYYGLPEWHEKDGKLKSYYEYELKIKTDRIINNKNSFYRVEKNKEYA